MSKKTTVYNVDLTVEPMPAASAEKKSDGQAGDAKTPPSAAAPAEPAAAKPEKAEKQPDVKAKDAGSPKADPSTPTASAPSHSGKKSAKKSKHKKGRKDSSSDASSSSSSSSSSSESDSDDEDVAGSRGVRRALESWRYPLYSPSASYRQLDTVAGSHQYTISGFSLARAMGCGTRLCSDLFEVAGQLFRLEVYPAGFTADTRKCVSVFLTTPGSLTPNHVLFEIAILDQSGKDKHIAATSSDAGRHLRHRLPLMTHARGVVGAVLKLAKTKRLEEKRKRYLRHDMLVLRATVHVLRGWSSMPAIHGHTAATSTLSPTLRPTTYLPNPLASSSVTTAPLMQGLVMPGFGLGPSTLTPVPVPLATAAPQTYVLPTGAPALDATAGLYAGTGTLRGVQPVYNGPGVVPLAAYAQPPVGYAGQPVMVPQPQWAGQPVYVNPSTGMPLA